MFSEDEFLLIEELVTDFLAIKAQGAVEIRLAFSILEKIDGQLDD